jgi:hypothetical protein
VQGDEHKVDGDNDSKDHDEYKPDLANNFLHGIFLAGGAREPLKIGA